MKLEDGLNLKLTLFKVLAIADQQMILINLNNSA